MNEDLRQLVEKKLNSEGLGQKNWSSLALAVCGGRDELERLLAGNAKAAPEPPHQAKVKKHAGAYLASLSVQGFRGIGPKQTLTLNPAPGLTVVIGRNGSGKSSFAEALEVLFTGDSKRWSDRPKIWKEGWRSLHNAHPAGVTAEVLFEGEGTASVCCTWEEGAELDDQKAFVQPKGKPKTTLEQLGWRDAVVSYRPFLSYNELGSLLDEGPSKLYDALSLVLGLEDLVTAQGALAESRLARQRVLDVVDGQRKAFVAALEKLLAEGSDDRASACLDALTSKSWGITEIEALLKEGGASPSNKDVNVLSKAVLLEGPDPERVRSVVTGLQAADNALKATEGTDAETSRKLAVLLEAAIKFHADHGDGDCPICGNAAALTEAWRDASQREVNRLRDAAKSSDEAHRSAASATRTAREMLSAPPKLLEQLFDIGLDGLDVVRDRWEQWHSGCPANDLLALATHLETLHEALADAIDALKEAAAAELRRREDRWRPIAAAIAAWTRPARDARAAAEEVPRIKAAENWLKDASGEIRNERFAPIADQAMATWQHLRQQSNVELGRIELAGTKSQRRVTLDVTVDGVAGAALGVMSQGELHSLALSLFLPRATLPASPFRFIVIDDPVQSMDPARIDGLARALEDAARSRQVIVFTHDERLPEAVRRLNIKSTILSVTRRPKSVVEVRTALDPVRAHIEDALALVYTTELPKDVLRRLVPGFCRSALEAAFISLVRRRLLAAGRLHSEVEEELKSAGKLTPLAAAALFGDKDKGGDVIKRLNQFGPWAGDVFKQCKDGAHTAVAGDLKLMIQDTEKLAAKVLELS
jgi:predicted ATPase